MSYHPACCLYPPGFDYSPESINAIPTTTIRKYGHSGWEPRFFYVEGDRVRAMQAQGKRILGTFTVAGDKLDKWATMPDAEWRSLIELYCDNLSISGVEIGNEVGGVQAVDYLPKLRIAAEVIHARGGWVMMGSPFPGGEAKLWDAAQKAGAFAWTDGVACHPYAKDPAASLAKVKGFRDHLSFLGVKQGLHLTEWGWPTDARGTKNPWVVSEAVQASYITEAFKLWKANAAALRVHNCFYYTYRDGFGPDYGVVRLDGSHKPGYAALAAAA